MASRCGDAEGFYAGCQLTIETTYHRTYFIDRSIYLFNVPMCFQCYCMYVCVPFMFSLSFYVIMHVVVDLILRCTDYGIIKHMNEAASCFFHFYFLHTE